MTKIKELDLRDNVLSKKAFEELKKNGVVIVNNFISN